MKKDKWYTWIDYERFQELYRSGKPFGAVDYMAETPSWAIYGSEEKGFDPEEVRFRKLRNHPNKNKKEETSAEPPPVSCSPA